MGAVVVGDGAEAEAAGADENVAGADVAASLVMTPAFLLSSICFSKQGILQSELHRALQTAPCYCPFDGGVVFGPLLALFGCKSSRDRGINGGFLIFGRAAGSRCRCRLRFFDLGYCRLGGLMELLLMLSDTALFQSPQFFGMHLETSSEVVDVALRNSLVAFSIAALIAASCSSIAFWRATCGSRIRMLSFSC